MLPSLVGTVTHNSRFAPVVAAPPLAHYANAHVTSTRVTRARGTVSHGGFIRILFRSSFFKAFSWTLVHEVGVGGGSIPGSP